MVPEQVPYKVFWSRYFFRLQALQVTMRPSVRSSLSTSFHVPRIGLVVTEALLQAPLEALSYSSVKGTHKHTHSHEHSGLIGWPFSFSSSSSSSRNFVDQLEDRKTQLLLSASDNLFGDDDDLTWDDEPESSEKPPALASNEASKQQAPGAVQNALACAQEEEAGQGEPGDIIGARGASRGDQEAVEMGQESSRNEAEGKGAGGGDVGRLGVSDGKRQDLSKAGDEGAAVLSSELRSDASSSTYVVSMPTSAEASLLASVDNASTGSSCSSTSAATSAPAALRAGDEGDAVGEGHAGAPEKVPAGEKGADARKEDEKKADDDWDDWE